MALIGSRQSGAQEDARLGAEIKAAHKRTKATCGPERLQKDMAAHGIQAGVCRIRRIRKKLGIRCKQVKKFKATTDSVHNLPVAENILGQNFDDYRTKQSMGVRYYIYINR